MSNFSNASTCCEGTLSENISLAVAYALLAVAGSFGNLLVIYLVYSVRKLRNTSNAFIVNVCAADLLVCALWMPRESVALSQPPGRAASAGYRTFSGGLLFLGLLVSLFSHSLVALNRFALITKAPAAYRNIYRRRNTAGMIASSWLLGAVLLLPWFTGPVRTQRRSRRCPQLLNRPEGCFLRLSPYPTSVAASAILGQTAVLLYSYFKIFRKVQVSVKRVSVLNFQIINNLSYPLARKDRRLRPCASFVLSVFVLTTEPLLWVTLIGLFEPVPALLYNVSWLLLSLLFVLSPYLYTRKNEEFRKSLRSVIGAEFCGTSVGVEPMIQVVSR
ncbi:probable G-protein coupled receptor 88 [Carcharodon carcharias]|uniref:probable G-protein coupled receptor 88 n=1 Tax=Carcharodon carcharias TaxID=13397 RepID=UPI001B7EA5E9|nr:probable G-protein coupled receptor 88 [Carcharodon carcharias]